MLTNIHQTLRNRPLAGLLAAAVLILGCCMPALGFAQDAQIDALVATWSEQYAQAESWQFEARAAECPEVHGVPDDTHITKEEALHIAIASILEGNATGGATLEALAADFVPHLTFCLDRGAPQWQIDLLPIDLKEGAAKAFTVYIDAGSGEVQALIYGEGNG